jgi:hypothetical protein
VVAFAVSILAPDGEGGGLSKNVRFAVGLMLITVCLFPLCELVETINNIDVNSMIPEESPQDYTEYFNVAYEVAEKENLVRGIEAMLRDRFSIDESEVDVSVTIDGGELKRIFIKLNGGAIWKDTGEIEAYLNNIFGCEVITAIG